MRGDLPLWGVWFSPSAETYYPRRSSEWFSRCEGHPVLAHYIVNNAVNYRCREVIVGASATTVTQSSYPGCLVWTMVLIRACLLEQTNSSPPPRLRIALAPSTCIAAP